MSNTPNEHMLIIVAKLLKIVDSNGLMWTLLNRSSVKMPIIRRLLYEIINDNGYQITKTYKIEKINNQK